MGYKIDLHTHSAASPDGGISRSQYESMLHQGVVDYVAVTDHNTIAFAKKLHAEFGERVIIGEEIMTDCGEIIGLYLEHAIPSGLTPLQTAQQIKDQGGLVYIPHPFETVRKGLSADKLEEILPLIDLVEVYNGRAFFQDKSERAVMWAKLHECTMAASSDAHGVRGVGKTYTVTADPPDETTLALLFQQGSLHTAAPGLRALLYPKYHRLLKKVRRG